MSGYIQKISEVALSELPLGATLERFDTGKLEIISYIDKWKTSSLVPRLKALNTQWNTSVVQIIGGLNYLYDLYTIDLDSFDSTILFLDPKNSSLWDEFFDRPSTVHDKIDSLYYELVVLKDQHSVTSVQIDKIKAYTPPASFLDLSDTPNSYATHAGKFLGINSNGTSIDFLYPDSTSLLTSLPDGPSQYLEDHVLISGVSSLETEHKDYINRWYIQDIAPVGLIHATAFSGAECDNVLYSVDLETMANNTSFHVTLGTTFDGARVGFKMINGENTNNNKYIHADTSAGVTMMNATPPDRYQMKDPTAYTYTYSTSLQSYLLTEKYEVP